jgi:hypothetical protein
MDSRLAAALSRRLPEIVDLRQEAEKYGLWRRTSLFLVFAFLVGLVALARGLRVGDAWVYGFGSGLAVASLVAGQNLRSSSNRPILKDALRRLQEVASWLGGMAWWDIAIFSFETLQCRVHQRLGDAAVRYSEASQKSQKNGQDCTAELAASARDFQDACRVFVRAGLVEDADSCWTKYFSHPPPPGPSAEPTAYEEACQQLSEQVEKRDRETQVAAFNPSGVSIGQIEIDDPAEVGAREAEEWEREQRAEQGGPQDPGGEFQGF